MMATLAFALVASGVVAQEAPRDPVRVMRVQPVETVEEREDRLERLEVLREELQTVYERLFELQVRYQSSGDDPAVLDSITVELEELKERGREISEEIAEANASRRPTAVAPGRRGEADVYVLFEQLSQLDSEIDPEEIGRIFENREGIDQGLELLGQILKDLEVDISPERVRIETGAGGKLSFSVPEELREELSEGMREIGPMLNRVFPDTAGGARNWADLIEQLPERFGQGFPDRRGRHRKVIAESAFSMGSDFEVADDEIVQGDVLLIGADAYVSGEVQGNVYVIMGDILVEERGLIAKDAVSIGGRVLVDNRAEILGRRLDFGDVSQFTATASGGSGVAWAIYIGRLVVLFALLLLVYALFSDRMVLMVEHATAQPGRTMFAGAIWFTCIFGLFAIASVGLAVSVIGIPVVLVLAVAMGVVSMMAYLAGCEIVGRRLVTLLRPDAPVRIGWQGALVGVALLELPAISVLILWSIGVDGVVTRPLTGLEFVVRFLALSLGFGAVVHTRLGRRPPAVESSDPAGDVVSAGA
jgi:hypothetical protein